MSTDDPQQSTPSARPRDAVSLEHAQDVLRAAADHLCGDRTGAMAVITATSGGAVRSPGALMFISDTGARFGYLSGGCIDADVALEAARALKTRQTIHKTYGAGSGALDLPLPCGGRIDVAITPLFGPAQVERMLADLQARKPSRYTAALEDCGMQEAFTAMPKLRIRMAGRGADLIALAKLAAAAGHDLVVQTPDAVTAEDLADAGIAYERLTVARGLTDSPDDAYTAFVLMFHDPDWETPLLLQAQRGPAFYIGAVGSAAAQSRRLEALREAGSMDVSRVRGPIGLVPSTRNASELAISTLAEIVSAFAGVRAAAATPATSVRLGALA